MYTWSLGQESDSDEVAGFGFNHVLYVDRLDVLSVFTHLFSARD